jgi:hypothetical protein
MPVSAYQDLAKDRLDLPPVAPRDVDPFWAIATVIVTTVAAMLILTNGGPDYRFLTPAISLLIGMLALYMAATQLATNRQIARTKNTLDFIFKFDTDKYYVDLRAKWAQKYEGNAIAAEEYSRILASLNSANPIPKYDGYIEICDFMTMMDVVAIAVENGIFDEKILLEVYGLQFLIYWNGVAPYLRSYKEYREQGEMLAFERLVQKCKLLHPTHRGI